MSSQPPDPLSSPPKANNNSSNFRVNVTPRSKSRSTGPISAEADDGIKYIPYEPAHESRYVAAIRQLISKDLSEPYSIYVYRYFLYQWGELCFMAMDPSENLIGVVVSKLEVHRSGPLRGYIAMLAVREEYRGKGIATRLVCMAIDAMTERDADEVALETETSNVSATKLYERLGFLRSKRLHRYYLNGNSAYRLVLYLKEGTGLIPTIDPYAEDEYERDEEGGGVVQGLMQSQTQTAESVIVERGEEVEAT